MRSPAAPVGEQAPRPARSRQAPTNGARVHLAEVDLLRAVALLGVALIHAGAWVAPATSRPAESVAAAMIGLARFCVPAFVFASGFVLFHAYGGRKLQTGSFLKRRWTRVLLPWACCVPLFLAIDAAKGQITWQAGAAASWLAFGPGHLYFLLLIAQLYLVFLVLPRDRVGLRWVAAAAVAIQLGLMAWHTYGPEPGGAAAWPGTFLAFEEAPFWLGTFVLGCLAALEWPVLSKLDRYWPLAVLASLAMAGLVLAEGHAVPADQWRQGNGAYLWPSRLPQTIVWSLTLMWLGRRFGRAAASRPVQELSRHSLGIYLLHTIPLDLLAPFTAFMPPAIRVPALVVLCLSGGYAAVRLVALNPIAALAIGEQTRALRAPA